MCLLLMVITRFLFASPCSYRINFLYKNLLQLEDSLLFVWLDYHPALFLHLVLPKAKYITYQLGREAHLSSTSLQILFKKKRYVTRPASLSRGVDIFPKIELLFSNLIACSAFSVICL
jgi:hypothetical protein